MVLGNMNRNVDPCKISYRLLRPIIEYPLEVGGEGSRKKDDDLLSEFSRF